MWGWKPGALTQKNQGFPHCTISLVRHSVVDLFCKIFGYQLPQDGAREGQATGRSLYCLYTASYFLPQPCLFCNLSQFHEWRLHLSTNSCPKQELNGILSHSEQKPCTRYLSLLTVHGTHLAHSCLRTFALVVSLPWDTLSPDTFTAYPSSPSSLY